MRLRTGWTRALIQRAYAAGVPTIWIVRAAMPVSPALRITSPRFVKALNLVCAIVWGDRDIDVKIRWKNEHIIRRESRKGKRG